MVGSGHADSGVFHRYGRRPDITWQPDKRDSRLDHLSVIRQADESDIGCVLLRSMMMIYCGSTQHRDSKVYNWNRGSIDV